MTKLVQLADKLFVPENFETNHVYFSDPEGTTKYTGVTTVLGVINKPAIIGWAVRMACDWIKEHCERETIQPTGADGTNKSRWFVDEQELEEAKNAHTRKKEDAGKKGTDVHAQIEEWVKYCLEAPWNGQAVLPEAKQLRDDDPMFAAFQKWAIDNKVKFIASEMAMYDEKWFVAGTADLVFEQDGKTYLGDIKTMKKLWDRTPFFQMAAYTRMYEKTTGNTVDGTCVINISKETNQLTTHYTYKHKKDIKSFEAALRLYRELKDIV